MKILKHGDLKERKFVCAYCGCEFVANCAEYGYTKDVIVVCCPECKHNNATDEFNAPLYISNNMPINCQACMCKIDCINGIDSKKYSVRCINFDDLKRWREANNESKINN